MPRQRLSEFRAKTIIAKGLELPYIGWPIDTQVPLKPQLTALSGSAFVVKVDQGIKGRFKKGLVLLDVTLSGLPAAVKKLQGQEYRWLIIEPFIKHAQSDERYLSIISNPEGLLLHYAASGGVDVEKQAEKIRTVRINDRSNWAQLAKETGLKTTQLRRLVEAFARHHFVFLEINPYLVNGNKLQILDAAVEVDDVAEFFVDSWQTNDFRRHSDQTITPQELLVQQLDTNSPASLKLTMLEPHGSIFLLLSGGGASIVVADEVYNQGFGKQLANYGEYSGNPNAEETYAYTKALLELLLASSAKQKVLFIGGAVANFTDIAKTFAGIIQAIEEVADKLRSQKLKVFVRRGGPNQEKGLAHIETALTKHGLLGAVHDPATPLTVAVTEALQEVRRG